MRKLVVIFCAVAFFTSYAIAGDWETLNYPDSKSTRITDIDGTSAIGQYCNITDSYNHTFLYNTGAKTWTSIDPHGSIGAWPEDIFGGKVVGISQETPTTSSIFLYNGDDRSWTIFDVSGRDSVSGILGNRVVGAYWSGGSVYEGVRHGFLYDAVHGLTIFDPPGSTGTYPVYSSGTQIVGSYYDASGSKHNFLYDGATEKFTDIDMPRLASQLTVYPVAVDTNNVIGNYQDGSDIYGFLYDGKNWLTLDYPGSLRTNVSDISGNSIVGQYTANDAFHTDHSFLYDIATKEWTNIDVPGAKYTQVAAIYGDEIVGYHHSSPDKGFIYTIPEPSTLALVIIALLSGFLFRRKFKICPIV